MCFLFAHAEGGQLVPGSPEAEPGQPGQVWRQRAAAQEDPAAPQIAVLPPVPAAAAAAQHAANVRYGACLHSMQQMSGGAYACLHSIHRSSIGRDMMPALEEIRFKA